MQIPAFSFTPFRSPAIQPFKTVASRCQMDPWAMPPPWGHVPMDGKTTVLGPMSMLTGPWQKFVGWILWKCCFLIEGVHPKSRNAFLADRIYTPAKRTVRENRPFHLPNRNQRCERPISTRSHLRSFLQYMSLPSISGKYYFLLSSSKCNLITYRTIYFICFINEN